MAKPDSDFSAGHLRFESAQLQGSANDRRKIFHSFVIADMRDVGPADQAGGKKPVSIRGFRLLDAIGGEKNRCRQAIELFLLILPGSTEMTGEGVIFFQCWGRV